MSYTHYPDYTFVSNDECVPHRSGNYAYRKLGQQQTSTRGDDNMCVAHPSPYHGGSYVLAPDFKYPIIKSVSSLEMPNTPSNLSWQAASSVLPPPAQLSSNQLDFNVQALFPISSSSSSRARNHPDVIPPGPLEDRCEAASFWNSSIGPQPVGFLLSNALSSDIYQLPTTTPETSSVFGSSFQNDLINGLTSMDIEGTEVGYYSQLTLWRPHSSHEDPCRVLPPAVDSNHPRIDQGARSEISWDAGCQNVYSTLTPAGSVPPLPAYSNLELKNISPLSLSSVQQKPIALPYNSTESGPNVADSVDWLIKPDMAREILSKASMFTGGQQPISVHPTRAKSQYWLAGDTNLDQVIQVEDTQVTEPDASIFSQFILTPTHTDSPQALPPPVDLTNYSVKQRGCLVRAFTKGSCHPSAALRGLLDFVLPSAFILNQTREPFLADKSATHILERILHLPQCPPIDFGNSKRSLFTLFVEKAVFRCLFCGMCCVRSHLCHKPFRCSGCQSCNPVDGYAQFGTSALLKDHLNGQIKKMKCGVCLSGVELRRGGMRRHWNSMHKHMPFPFHDHPRYRRIAVGSKQPDTSVSAFSEDVEGLLDYLPDCESD
ncbi:hypothetical protein M408DRAFT_11965 [Serendipita vermifera MAFF 305830]|uniref:Uncharacterized protein n=1 Tax=Serendipita vermifera MAFF 305830 TaxID=933852 RepID=A0A0C3ATM1_SERVB|nr:hypothetical protein M408DRAFT_11965 [Serendipita vermifera MAFF 305830]